MGRCRNVSIACLLRSSTLFIRLVSLRGIGRTFSSVEIAYLPGWLTFLVTLC